MPNPLLLNGILESQKSGHLYTLAGSYDALASVTVPSGGLASVTFAGIPTGYTHLQLRGVSRTDNAGAGAVNINMYFNGDTTSANYYSHQLYGTGSAAGSAAVNNPSYVGVSINGGATASTFAGLYVDILDYANIYKYKTSRCLSGVDTNNSNGFIQLGSSVWSNTAAITSISFTPSNSSNFAQYSSFALYGVK
jgi:hypothetical protein